MAVVCSAPKGEKGSIVPRNGLSTASLFELVQPLAEPTTDRAVMRAYRVNPISIFPGRAYEEDRVVRPFFGRPSILTSRAEDIRHVLLDNADNYRRSRAGVRILRPLGDGLFMASGAAWRAQRRTIAPAFVPSAVSSFAKAGAEALIPARRDLLDRAQAPVDLLGWLQSLTLDVAGRALFSLPLNDQLGRAIRNQIGDYGLRYGRPSFLDFAVPLWLPSPRDLGRFRFRRRLFALIDRLIAARRGLVNDPRRRDLFDLLIAADWMAGGDSMAKLRNQVATLIVAGHETTAIALFWALHLLAREPDWQERLAAEAMAQDLTPAGIGEAVSALTLSRAVVDEAMRLFPPAYVIVRQAISDDRLDDLPVEPGTVILISPWVLHRHRQLWREPDVFAPERFLDKQAPIGRFAYLPFGAGPRVCVGASLAVTEATIVLSTLLRAFRIEPADMTPVLPVGAITTQPNRAPLFRLIPRSKGTIA